MAMSSRPHLQEGVIAMENDTVVALRQPGELDDLLTDVLRRGARKLLAQAVDAEVADFLAAHSDLTTEDAGNVWCGTVICRSEPFRPGSGLSKSSSLASGIAEVMVRRSVSRQRSHLDTRLKTCLRNMLKLNGNFTRLTSRVKRGSESASTKDESHLVKRWKPYQALIRRDSSTWLLGNQMLWTFH